MRLLSPVTQKCATDGTPGSLFCRLVGPSVSVSRKKTARVGTRLPASPRPASRFGAFAGACSNLRALTATTRSRHRLKHRPKHRLLRVSSMSPRHGHHGTGRLHVFRRGEQPGGRHCRRSVVEWSATTGTVDSAGTYRAPSQRVLSRDRAGSERGGQRWSSWGQDRALARRR